MSPRSPLDWLSRLDIGRQMASKDLGSSSEDIGEPGDQRALNRKECGEFLAELEKISHDKRAVFLEYFVGYWQSRRQDGSVVINHGALAFGSVEQQQAVSTTGAGDSERRSAVMSIEVIAASAVALIVPYLAKAGEKVAEAAGESAAAAAGRVAEWLRGKLTGRAGEALADLEKAPENEDNQADLRKQLTKLLEAEPALAEQLRALIPAEAADQGAMNQSVTGAGAKVQQIRGSGNKSSIR